MSEWQPIETAPKGGFPQGFTGRRLVTDPAWVEPPTILAWDGRQLQVVYWDWYYAEGGNGYTPGCSAWVSPDGERVEPTHWMPLPEPPK
jgi:hypothetical protein